MEKNVLPANLTLREGDSGEHVLAMQQRLVKYNLLEEEQINGFFDTHTASALRSFQNMNSLKADAVAGPVTMRALNLGRADTENNDASFDDSTEDEHKEKNTLLKSDLLAEKENDLIDYGPAPLQGAVETPQPPSEEAQKDLQQQMETTKFTWDKDDAYEAVIKQDTQKEAKQKEDSSTIAAAAPPPANPFAKAETSSMKEEEAVKREIIEQGKENMEATPAIASAPQNPFANTPKESKNTGQENADHPPANTPAAAPPANPFAKKETPENIAPPPPTATTEQATETAATPAVVPPGTASMQIQTAQMEVSVEGVLLDNGKFQQVRQEIEPKLTPQARHDSKQAGVQLVKSGARENEVPADIAVLDAPAQAAQRNRQSEQARG